MDGRGTRTNAIGRLVGAFAATALVLAFAPLVNATAQAEISIASPSGGYVATHTPTFEGVTDDILDNVTLDIYAGPHVEPEALKQTLSTFLPPTGGTWSLEAESLSDGTYTAQASQTNTLGETSSSEPPVTFHVDTAKPEVSLDPVHSPTNDETPTLAGHSGTAEGDLETVIVKVYEGGSASGNPVRTLSVTASGGEWSTSVDPALGDGTYTAQAEQSDEAGNTGASATSTFTVDTAVPAVSLTPVDSPTNESSPGFGGGAGNAAGDIAEVKLKIYSGSTASGIPIRTATVAPTGASWSATLGSGLVDGTYTAQAEQSNEAGSTGKSAPSTFTIDTTKPSVHITSPTNGSFINASKPTISGTAGTATGDQATVTVNVYSGSSVSGSPTQTLNLTSSGGSWSTGSSGPQLEEGTYTLQAEQSDEAGNTGVSAPTTFTIKTKAPAVSLTPLSTPTNNPTPSFGGAAGAAAGDDPSVTLKVYAGATATGTPVRTLSNATSGATWSAGPVASLADGTYTAQAQQSDEAGDTGFSAPSTFTIDTTKPSVHITSPTNGSFINASKPTISGTAGTATGDQATVTVNVYSGSSVSGSPTQTLNLTSSGGSWSTGSSGPQLEEGTYTLQAEQSDEAGNTGVSAPTTFTIKTKAPAVSLTPLAPLTNNPTPSFGGAAGTAPGDEPSITLKVYAGATATGTPVRTLSRATSGATWAVGPVAALADGTYTAVAEQSDEGGDVGVSAPSTFTVDTTKPSVHITSPPNGSFINVSKPTISGTAGSATGDQATVTVNVYSGSSVSGTPTQLAVTRSGSSWSTGSSGPQLKEGTYTLQAEQSDEAGNTGFSTPTTFTINTKSPAVSLTPLSTPTNNPTPSFGGAAGTAPGDDSSITLKIYAGSNTSGSLARPPLTATPNGATWATGPIASLADGTYTAQAEQSDEAGNPPGKSAPSTFTIDTTKPIVHITSPTNGSFINVSKPTISGTAGTATGDQATVTVKIYSGSSVSGSLTQTLTPTRSGGGSWTTESSGLPEGTYTLQAEQSDGAGNTGSSTPATFTIKTKAPAVSLTPLSTPTNNPRPSFGGAAGAASGDNASVTLKIYAGATATGTPVRTLPIATSGEKTWATGPVERLKDGTYTARAEQADQAGNTGITGTSTFTVDTLPPAVTLLPGSSERHTSTPIFSGSAGEAVGDLASVTLNIYSGKTATGSPIRSGLAVVSAGKWTGAPSAGLPNGTYTTQAEQFDEAGNVGKSQPAIFTIVSSGPVVTLTPIAKVSNESAPSFGGSAGVAAGDSPVRLKVFAGSSASASEAVRKALVSPVGGTWSTGATEPLPDGTYTALAEQSDSLGNTGVSAETTFTVDTVAPVVTLTSPANGSSTGATSVSVQGAAGTAAGDASTVSVELVAGANPDAAPLQTRVVTVTSGQWQVTFEGLAPGTYTTRAEQSDEAGNTRHAGPVTFTVVSSASASSPPQPPAASFTWQPNTPHTGEAVSLLSSSTDPSSPLTGFAWDLLGTGPLNAGPATISTSFSTPGDHVVRLRVAAADSLSSIAAETIPVMGPARPLIQPFPVVRIVSTDTASGIKLKLLRVLAPAGARIGVICRNRGCPVKSLAKIASANSSVSAYTFPRLQRPLRAGVVLEVRISKAGQIGKYTRLVVRRGRLPQRLDLCVDSAGAKPIACPVS
jgi:major membrane immunogen (membrane-anchored lipoprotein)